jgi:hypothetical protein
METTFLFWNLNRKPLQQIAAALARSRNVDVLVLLECDIPVRRLLAALNQGDRPIFHYAPSRAETPNEAIKVFTRFSAEFLDPLEEERGLTIRHLKLPAMTDVILAAVHFPSKLHWDLTSQALECTALARAITRVEDRVGHTRTMLFGDLNMNPFEAGVVGA